MNIPIMIYGSVRQIEFLYDALKGYEGKTATYYPAKEISLDITSIAQYKYIGVLHFPAKIEPSFSSKAKALV